MAAFGAIMAKVGAAISLIAAPVVLAVGSVLVLAAGFTYAALRTCMRTTTIAPDRA
jgi:hypothetical protein